MIFIKRNILRSSSCIINSSNPWYFFPRVFRRKKGIMCYRLLSVHLSVWLSISNTLKLLHFWCLNHQNKMKKLDQVGIHLYHNVGDMRSPPSTHHLVTFCVLDICKNNESKHLMHLVDSLTVCLFLYFHLYELVKYIDFRQIFLFCPPPPEAKCGLRRYTISCKCF